MADESKTFTQEELDQKIQDRLARQKAKFEDETKDERVELETLRKERQERIKADEAAAHAEIDDLKTKVDPAVLELLPEELPLEKQLEWLKKASGQLPKQDKVTSPKTPVAKKGEKDFTPYPVKRKLI